MTVESLPPAALREAIAALWTVPPPGPDNIYYAPEFFRVREACKTLYPEACAGSGVALDFALGHALDALGLPCRPPPADPRLALPPEIAAGRLHAAFKQSEIRRVHLCPLDRADLLPGLTFGPNRIARFAAKELDELVDWPRLRRVTANWAFDTKLFSEFTWLMVEETLPVHLPPGQRAIPILFEPIGRDWGAIEPHRGRFPPAVSGALFAMLLAPWEDWIASASGWWRAFEVPWVYTIEDDLFVRPKPPPSPDALSWDYDLDDDEEEVFFDPNRVPLKDGGTSVLDWLTDRRWGELATLQESQLFETPVKHFFVKAFLEEPADEFLAHITTIEAALLLEDERSGLTRLVARRVAALLRAPSQGKVYEHLYNVRCAIVHGRKMDAIPGDSRLSARQLARQVVNALIEAALDPSCPTSRENYLRNLAS
jgi:Apea-like HEPN